MAAFEVDFFGGQDSVTDTSSGSAGVAVAEQPVAEQVAEPTTETSGPGSHCATPAKTATEWLANGGTFGSYPHPDESESESYLTENSDGSESADDEENISDELREARREFIRASIELARAKKAQKRCQKRFDYCLEMMMDLTQDQIGGDDSDDSDGESDGDSDEPHSATVADSTPVAPAAHIREVISRDEWQKVSIDQLGLKESLCEKLKEAGLDTIGRLESRRAEIYSGFEKWPKGIGQAKVTEIENAVLDWLAKNRQDDDKISTSTEGELADSVDPDALETTEPVGETITQEPVPPVPETEINREIFESGRQAYDQNAKVDECPWTPGAEADSWIAGWKSAQAEDKPKSTVAATVVTDLLEGL